jgi:peptide deformylase
MTVRDIVLYAHNPAPLRKKCKAVKGVNRHTRRLIRDLQDTLSAHVDGVGLAAPQINVHRRVVVVRLGSGYDDECEPDSPIALLNPKIIEAKNERKDFDGCLSFPGLYATTIRPHNLRVIGLDEDGNSFDRIFTGFDAVVVHHEIDHLDGVLFIDRVERFEDFFEVHEDKTGRLIRVPLLVALG